MSKWENVGLSDEWYTPPFIFDAMNCRFDLDVAAPKGGNGTFVPANSFISNDSLNMQWSGYIWMNPPFGGRNGIVPWLKRFCDYSNGVALTPDRTSAPWWQDMAKKCDGVLFIYQKVKFIRPDGSIGKSPSTGTSLFAIGDKACNALITAQTRGLGKYFSNAKPARMGSENYETIGNGKHFER